MIYNTIHAKMVRLNNSKKDLSEEMDAAVDKLGKKLLQESVKRVTEPKQNNEEKELHSLNSMLGQHKMGYQNGPNLGVNLGVNHVFHMLPDELRANLLRRKFAVTHDQFKHLVEQGKSPLETAKAVKNVLVPHVLNHMFSINGKDFSKFNRDYGLLRGVIQKALTNPNDPLKSLNSRLDEGRPFEGLDPQTIRELMNKYKGLLAAHAKGD